jgi:hypothetical protein
MKKVNLMFLLYLLIGCTSSKLSLLVKEKKIGQYIEDVRLEYAPDKRVALFNVHEEGNVLYGETNISEAKKALLEKLEAEDFSLIDNIFVLPTEEMQSHNFGVVTLSVANLRSEPRHPAELSTQATLGTAVKVYKKSKGWYLVQTPDHYLAWIDGGGIVLMNKEEYSDWEKKPKLIFTEAYGFSYDQTNKGSDTVSDLVYGDILGLEQQEGNYYSVSFPDGRTGFVKIGESQKYDEWLSKLQPNEENLVSTSKKFIGLPYLWGGTSFKGVDCSGFTKSLYLMNGLVLPRDASQQVLIGETVDTSLGWGNMKPGDLLFFGTPEKKGRSERVVHVGMWIGGEQEFIHSSGKVRISSMNPDAENYDEPQLKRFLRAKHVTPDDVILDLRDTNSF